jgi:hypothetical protein
MCSYTGPHCGTMTVPSTEIQFCTPAFRSGTAAADRARPHRWTVAAPGADCWVLKLIENLGMKREETVRESAQVLILIPWD